MRHRFSPRLDGLEHRASPGVIVGLSPPLEPIVVVSDPTVPVPPPEPLNPPDDPPPPEPSPGPFPGTDPPITSPEPPDGGPVGPA
jgi:hypothetical protein